MFGQAEDGFHEIKSSLASWSFLSLYCRSTRTHSLNLHLSHQRLNPHVRIRSLLNPLATDWSASRYVGRLGTSRVESTITTKIGLQCNRIRLQWPSRAKQWNIWNSGLNQWKIWASIAKFGPMMTLWRNHQSNRHSHIWSVSQSPCKHDIGNTDEASKPHQ